MMNLAVKWSSLGVIVALAFSGCAPTMSVETELGSSASLNRSALHYIVPPAATDSAQIKDLYPMVVNAFRVNHIALTDTKKAATYVVTWETEAQSKQARTVDAVATSSDLNVNSYGYYGGAGQSMTGPEYVPVMRSYHVQDFTISVWKAGKSENEKGATALWSGSATVGAKNVTDPAPIINEIVARYGMDFKGNTEIKAAALQSN